MPQQTMETQETNPEILGESFSGFYRLKLSERLAKLRKVFALSDEDLDVLTRHQGFDLERADQMIENTVGVFPLPLGFATNFRVDGQDFLLPMVIEEPSVVAAASHGAKLLREGDGIRAHASDPVMIGQIQMFRTKPFEECLRLCKEHEEEILELANQGHDRLRAAGGGAVEVQVHSFKSETLPVADYGDMLVVHLLVNVGDAMGANIINSMVERIGPYVQKLLGGVVHVRILSNLAVHRTVRVEGRIPFPRLARPGYEPLEVAHGLVQASIFAEADPFRATTGNKGVMNGVDAFLLATGQDFRAVEAGAHAYVARNGRYGSLTRWRIEGDEVVGRMELPMAVGTVGGVVKVHPTVRLLLRLLGIKRASTLSRLAAALGLAQNLTAILALSTVGIQAGHMSLHARNIVAALGAAPREIEEVVKAMVSEGRIDSENAKRHLERLKGA